MDPLRRVRHHARNIVAMAPRAASQKLDLPASRQAAHRPGTKDWAHRTRQRRKGGCKPTYPQRCVAHLGGGESARLCRVGARLSLAVAPDAAAGQLMSPGGFAIRLLLNAYRGGPGCSRVAAAVAAVLTSLFLAACGGTPTGLAARPDHPRVRPSAH